MERMSLQSLLYWICDLSQAPLHCDAQGNHFWLHTDSSLLREDFCTTFLSPPVLTCPIVSLLALSMLSSTIMGTVSFSLFRRWINRIPNDLWLRCRRRFGQSIFGRIHEHHRSIQDPTRCPRRKSSFSFLLSSLDKPNTDSFVTSMSILTIVTISLRTIVTITNIVGKSGLQNVPDARFRYYSILEHAFK